MDILSLSFLPADATVFSIIVGLMPIIVTVYGFWQFWPRFVKQKRIENIAFNARETLFIVTDLENAFHGLYTIINNPPEASCNNNRVYEIQLNIWAKLNALRSALMLLRNDANLQKMHDINDIAHWVVQVGDILEQRTQKSPQSLFQARDLFLAIDAEWERPNNELFTINPLEKLKHTLVKIYEYRNPSEF